MYEGLYKYSMLFCIAASCLLVELISQCYVSYAPVGRARHVGLDMFSYGEKPLINGSTMVLCSLVTLIYLRPVYFRLVS
jgi:hypothetical protein